MEKVEEGVEEPKGSWIPQEQGSQNQLSWTHRDSQTRATSREVVWV